MFSVYLNPLHDLNAEPAMGVLLLSTDMEWVISESKCQENLGVNFNS